MTTPVGFLKSFCSDADVPLLAHVTVMRHVALVALHGVVALEADPVLLRVAMRYRLPRELEALPVIRAAHEVHLESIV